MLMFFKFSESALRNVKSLKQSCTALIMSGTSTWDDTDNIFGKADKNLDDLGFSWIYWERRGEGVGCESKCQNLRRKCRRSKVWAKTKFPRTG